MIFKCKMCGGDMEYMQGASVMECPYCGTNQTLPKVDDERLAQMHSRANHLRLMKEFDKAQMIYEEIVAENPKDAEAHWCALLCRYGIEYVEDPYSRDRKPTMHRTQFDAITEDAHYLSAIEYADSVARDLYEHEAQLIDRIRRRYLSIASKEEPFDVFICYKETGENGQRTKDSVYAQEIYNELTREGYKVFFARITLEDKLGEAYEPYIFAALGSAKVMLVVGTSAAHMQAEWVKNEWKRYLYLMKQDSKKKLIPVYRDMEAYDMPEEFVYMQAQDYGKIGALQDLVRGVEKIAGKKQALQPATAPVQQVMQQTVVQQQGAGVESLMRRAQLFLEDGDWKSANEYLNKVLDINPEHAPAYFGKVMVKYAVRKEGQFAESDRVRDSRYEDDADWKKAIRFADAAQRNVYDGYLASVKQRRKEKADREQKAKEETRIREILQNAQKSFNRADSIDGYVKVKAYVEAIKKDPRAQELISACDTKIEEIKSNTYDTAIGRMQVASSSMDFYEILHKFESLGGYRDSEKLAMECIEKYKETRRTECAQEMARQKAEDERREQQRIIDERNRQIATAKVKKRNIALVVCTVLAIAVTAVYLLVLDPMIKYNGVEKLLGQGEYEQANNVLIELAEKNYKDAAQRIGEPYYVQAENLLSEAKGYLIAGGYSELAEKRYDAAAKAFSLAGTYRDAQGRINEPTYLKAEMYLDAGWYENAAETFRMAGDYSDASERIGKTYYDWAEMLISMSMYKEASEAFAKAGDYGDAAQRIGEPYYTWAEILLAEEKYAEASAAFRMAGTYSDAAQRIGEPYYKQAESMIEIDDRLQAIHAFIAAGTYRDAKKRATEISFALAQEYEDKGEKLQAALLYRKTETKEGIRRANQLMRKGRISAGNSTTIGVKENKVAVAVGANDQGQLDVNNWRDITAVAAGYSHTVGLRENGTVVAVGKDSFGSCDIGDWTNIVAVDAGYSHTVGLRADGTVFDTSYYINTRNWEDVVSISARGTYTAGVKSDGTVLVAGFDDKYEDEIREWNGIVDVAISGHIVGLKADGTVVASGENGHGQCDVDDWCDIVAVAAGRSHTVGLKADGTVVATGSIGSDVTSWQDIVEISAGYYYTVGLKADGSVLAVGNNMYGQCNVTDWDLVE